MKPYACPICTFMNENPKPHCEICQSAAPEDAYLPDEPTEEEKAQQAKIEQEKIKAKERMAKQELAEADRKAKVEQLKKDMIVLHNETIDYYKNSKILDFLFASHLGG